MYCSAPGLLSLRILKHCAYPGRDGGYQFLNGVYTFQYQLWRKLSHSRFISWSYFERTTASGIAAVPTDPPAINASLCTGL
jgi:hypothetical protein